MKQKVVVLERGGLRATARHGLEDRDNGAHDFLKVSRELPRVLPAHDVVKYDVIRAAEDYEIFFGEVGDFDRRIGEPVIIFGAKRVVGGMLHAGGNFPAGGNVNGELDGALFAADEIHPGGRAGDEGVAVVILADVVLQIVGVDLVIDGDGGGAAEFNAPRLAVGLAPSEFPAVGVVGAKTLHVGGIVFDAVRAGRPVGHGEIGGGSLERVGPDSDVHQMRIGALKSKLVAERSGSGNDRGRHKEKQGDKRRSMNQAARHESSRESKQELASIKWRRNCSSFSALFSAT